MLQEMFGEDSVPKIFKGEKLYVTVDGKKANIDLLNLVSTTFNVCVTTHTVTSPEHDNACYLLQEVSCEEDEAFQQIVQTAVTKLYQSLAPPRTD
jgi:cleavage and polyadenylation specificity factor subunit 3